MASTVQFRKLLLAWYDAHARALPWRESQDPYRVWVSEIMLQQTRVAAVIAHYREFLRRFPTVEALGQAREAAVLAAWSGLGYYRRARMMHAAAKVVARELDGKFPETAHGWRELPGVGRYTAAAVASIAFSERVAAVDGNVERVLERFSGRRMKAAELWSTAQEFLDPQRPGDFNQAMMELGATVCTPEAPACLTCPVVDLCGARGELKARPSTAPQRKREIDYLLDCRGGSVFLVRRSQQARLMPGMWELPELNRWRVSRMVHNKKQPLFIARHSITVTDYTVRVWSGTAQADTRGKWILFEKLPGIPLTGLARKILRKAEVLDIAARAV